MTEAPKDYVEMTLKEWEGAYWRLHEAFDEAVKMTPKERKRYAVKQDEEERKNYD